MYLGLGVWIGTIRSGSNRTPLLAAFAILLGLAFLPAAVLPVLAPSLAGGSFPSPLVAALRAPLVAAAWAVALGLAWSSPRPLEDRGLLWTALGVGFGLSLAGAGLSVVAGGFAAAPVGWAHVWVAGVGHGLGLGFLYAAGVLLALRAHPGRLGDAREAAGLGLLAVVLALPVAVPAGMAVVDAGRALAVGEGVRVLAAGQAPLAWSFVAGLWGRNLLAAGDETARIHRWTLHGILGAVAVGAVYRSAVSSSISGFSLLDGLAVVLAAGLLAHGVLRHDLAGADVRVRWPASSATVAGVAVAAFVLAGLGGLLLTADAGPSLHLGVLAACASLVAWWRLDPEVERLVGGPDQGPGLGGLEGASDRRAVSIYMGLVRRFESDGDLSRAEEQALANLAKQLDLDPGRAFALRMEGTHEAAGPEASAPDGQGPGPTSRAVNGSRPDGVDGASAGGSAAAAARADPAAGERAVSEGDEDGPTGAAADEVGPGAPPSTEDGTLPGGGADPSQGEPATVVAPPGPDGQDPTGPGGNGAEPRDGLGNEAGGETAIGGGQTPTGTGSRDGGSEDEASADGPGAGRGAGDDDREAEAAAARPGGSPAPDGIGDGGGAGNGSGPGGEPLEGRMELRRNEAGEVEMVIHETPWGDVRVDLGEIPDEE